MKKIKALFLFATCFCCTLASTAYAGNGYVMDGEITFYEELENSKNYSLNVIPKITVRYNLQDTVNNYTLRLSGDEGNTDLIKMYPTDGLKSYTYELPTLTEGTHNYTLELLKNGETVYSEAYKKSYIKTVATGYGNRGFCTHFGHSTYVSSDADLLVASGSELYRDGIYWSIERQKGNYDWTAFNSNFSHQGLNNMDLFFVAAGTNDLYKNDDGGLKIVTEEQIDGFANYCLAVAKKYPSITKFEIMNEPGFEYTGTEYAKIINTVARKLKSYDRDIKVYAGCVVNANGSGEVDLSEEGKHFIEEFLDKNLYPYIDAVSYHIYTHWNYAECGKRFITMDKNYTDVIAQRGGWKPLALSETGWSTIQRKVDANDPDSEYCYADADYKKQASELVKRAVVTDGLGYSDITFYDFKNDGTLIENREHNFGVLENNYTPKDSYYTMKNYFNNVGKAQYIGKAKFVDGITAHAYRSDKDGNFLITWATPITYEESISENDYPTANYTFAQNVEIKDMYGVNTETGNNLYVDYAPKYVYGFTDREMLAMIKAYGTDELISLPKDFADIQNAIKEEYNKLLDAGTIDAVNNYTNYCYGKGNDLIAQYKTGTVEMTEEAFSNMLYNIYLAASKGSRTLVCCTGIPDSVNTADVVAEYDAVDKLIDFEDLARLSYFAEPYNKGKELLKNNKRYNENGRGKSVSGNGYELLSDGTLKLSGKTEKSFVSIKITNGEELIYINTLKTTNGEYEIPVELPGYGEYTLKTSENGDQTISFANEGYSSTEDAMTYYNASNAQGLLNWTKTLAEDIFESKASGLPSYITKKTIGEKNYLSVNKEEKKGVVFAAAYKDGYLKSVSKETESGVCMLDVTGLDDYTVKVFDWSEFMIPNGPSDVFENVKQ